MLKWQGSDVFTKVKMDKDNGQAKRFGFVQFRFVIAAILLLAAGLKAYQLATAPLPPVVQDSVFTFLLELLNDRYFLMLVVVGEILFALVLIAGIWRQWTWLLSLLGFSVFTLVSLMKGLSGESSCGCFGPGHDTTIGWFSLSLVYGLLTLSVIRNAIVLFAKPTVSDSAESPPAPDSSVPAAS